MRRITRVSSQTSDIKGVGYCRSHHWTIPGSIHQWHHKFCFMLFCAAAQPRRPSHGGSSHCMQHLVLWRMRTRCRCYRKGGHRRRRAAPLYRVFSVSLLPPEVRSLFSSPSLFLALSALFRLPCPLSPFLSSYPSLVPAIFRPLHETSFRLRSGHKASLSGFHCFRSVPFGFDLFVFFRVLVGQNLFCLGWPGLVLFFLFRRHDVLASLLLRISCPSFYHPPLPRLSLSSSSPHSGGTNQRRGEEGEGRRQEEDCHVGTRVSPKN